MTTQAANTITDEILCQEILSLFKRFKAIMAQVADAYNLTTMQLGALHAINEGYITMGKVAQTMHCDASNVTGIVDRLVAMKMVIRQEDPHDRRVKVLALTAKGREVLTEVTAELPVGLGCSRLSADEITDMHRLLRKLH